jgi:hypothetical protein
MDFPVLSTGAIQQYPARRSVEFRTEVLQFLDGGEQRFRQRRAGLHAWRIDLDLLNEAETTAVRQFFESARGRQGSFRFQDPWDGTVYSDCSLADDTLDLEVSGEMRGRLSLMVRENA